MRMIGLLVILSAVTLAAPRSAHALGAFLQWQDTSDMNSGFGVGLTHRIQIIPIISVDARASWLGIDGKGGLPDVNAYPLEAVGRAKLGLLYAGAGLGYFFFSGDEPRPKGSFGGSILAGIEISLAKLGAFGELRYLFLEPDEKDEVGGTRDLGGFGVNLGVMLPF
jgi:hypothetical protein